MPLSPTIAATEPIAVTVEAGDIVWWCACGLSALQPVCDGSHAGTEFRPKQWIAESDGEVWLCACKHTKTPPLCDGSHAELAE